MELETYQKSSERTLPDLGSIQLNLAHMALGICDEADEIDEAYTARSKSDLADEIGDQMFYIAGYCTFKKYSMKEVALYGQNVSLYQAVFRIAGHVKKFVAYNKEIEERTEKELLGTVIKCGQILCGQLDIDFGEVLEKNIKKLKIRFPKKFDQKAAINKNSRKEKKIFKK